MRPLLLSGGENMAYSTREEYWRAKGREGIARTVGQRTARSLRRKGIVATPESAVYKKEFDRLAGIYRSEQANKTIKRKAREAAWREAHANDTDEQLLAYLRAAVTEPEQLKKTTLVTGGPHIAAHFGGWQKALRLAGLIPPEETSNASPEEQALSPPEDK